MPGGSKAGLEEGTAVHNSQVTKLITTAEVWRAQPVSWKPPHIYPALDLQKY